jgi:hypothetical protein
MLLGDELDCPLNLVVCQLYSCDMNDGNPITSGMLEKV